ncbi:MAG: 50S ribosomal protein L25 [Candidatus Lambdaproteobacteria bacterium]|nr:50S ribosomal protein L25 [Candidatus Lambdaproteobacteria bacterium]
MTELMLEATPRGEVGKGRVRKLRRQGEVPAIVYGLHEPMVIKLDERAVSKLVQQLHGSERLIRLRVQGEGAGDKHVILKDAQKNALGTRLLHVDFHEIDIKKTIHVSVEVRPVGVATGVRLGGILQTVHRELAIECLPTAIPEFIGVDVTALPIGGSIHAKDVAMPEGVRLLSAADETMFVVAAQMKEEVVEAPVVAAELAPAAAAAPGVEAPKAEPAPKT